MKTVTIKNITLGAGKPKICLPIVGKTFDEITMQAERIIQNPVDIIEWRADWFCDVINPFQVNTALKTIKSVIGELPLLFTIRTANEGGQLDISFEDYSNILTGISANPLVDAVDVEILMASKDIITQLITGLKSDSVVIASNHNFNNTPDIDTLVERLKYMEQCGADVCKIAVMPQSKEDVLTLLAATNKAYQILNTPVITMSMGQSGLISRLAGEIFGSSLTFGCVGQASAPGQIDAMELNTVLEILHKNM